MRLFFILLLVVAFTGAADMMFAQAGKGRGRLRGYVVDKEDNPVPEAEVEIIWHEDKNIKHKMTANKKGRFAFGGLAGGNWQIFVTADGFGDTQITHAIQQIPDNPLAKVVMNDPPAPTKVDLLSEDATLVDKGKKLFAEAKYDEALEAYEEFLIKQPDFYQTHLLIGNCYREKGEYEKAMEKYKEALSNAPTDGSDKDVIASINSAIGELYIRKNDLVTAQTYFQKSLSINPKDEILAYNVGEIFFSNNKTAEAIKYFKLASTIKPNWGQPYLKMGYTYLNTADYKNAIASFNKFMELSPDSPDVPVIKELIESLKGM